MRYTPGQLQEAVGLSKEAFRHWKRVLPGFARGKSHGPSFSPGDVLASIVLQRLTRGCGVRIGELKTVASTIFDVCNETSWNVLADKTLIVDLARRDCSMFPKTDPMPGDSAVLVCPMEPIIGKLRDHLVRSAPIATEKARGHAAKMSSVAPPRAQHR